MLFVAGTNAIHHAIGLQHILLAEHLARLFVRAVSAQDFTGKALAAVFVHTARDRIHVGDGSRLMEHRLILRRCERTQRQHNAKCKNRLHGASLETTEAKCRSLAITRVDAETRAAGCFSETYEE